MSKKQRPSSEVVDRLPVQARALRYRRPDYTEARSSDRHLLIWGDVPHWMVVDGEFLDLLESLDGSAPAESKLEACNLDGAVRVQVLAQLESLLGLGILVDAQLPMASPASPPRALPRLENLALNLTRRCNLRCKFCYNLANLQKTSQGELRADEIARFLKATRRFRAPGCVLTILGGEPLIEEEKLLTVAQAATREGLSVLVSTNGTGVSERFARQARALRLDIQVSVDGPSESVHDAVRGAGVFARLSEGLGMLSRHGVRPIVSLVCHQGNVGALEAFYAWARQAGAAEARFIPLKMMGGAVAGDVRPVSLPDLMRASRALFEQHPEFLAMAGRDAFSVLGATCRMSSRRYSCGAGYQTVLLDADGSLYPCLNTNRPEFRLGNVRDPDFDFGTTWERSSLLEEFRRATAIDGFCCSCEGCVVRYWCLGGCKGETLAQVGNLRAPAWNCGEWREAILELFWTLAERPDLVRAATRIC